MSLRRVCVFLLGGLALLSCSGEISLIRYRVVNVSGRVTTTQGEPVDSVSVGTRRGGYQGFTDSEGRYQIPKYEIAEWGCENITVYFEKGIVRKDVHVGKCGPRIVDFTSWPEEG